VQKDFCNKICHERTRAAQQTASLLNGLGCFHNSRETDRKCRAATGLARINFLAPASRKKRAHRRRGLKSPRSSGHYEPDGHHFLTSWLPTVLNANGVPLAHAVIAGSLIQGGGALGSLIVGRLLDRVGMISIVMAFIISIPFVVLIGAVAMPEYLLGLVSRNVA
jgi:hypothetical protein